MRLTSPWAAISSSLRPKESLWFMVHFKATLWSIRIQLYHKTQAPCSPIDRFLALTEVVVVSFLRLLSVLRCWLSLKEVKVLFREYGCLLGYCPV
jgi:hypothetical protein